MAAMADLFRMAGKSEDKRVAIYYLSNVMHLVRSTLL
jgi:hypothetical protein